MAYRYCLVPTCKNTSIKTPEKVFLSVPQNENTRKEWCRIMNRKFLSSAKSSRYVCEDHFDLEKDTKNYMQYKIQGGKLFLKRGVVPHIFKSQTVAIQTSDTMDSRSSSSEFLPAPEITEASDDVHCERDFNEKQFCNKSRLDVKSEDLQPLSSAFFNALTKTTEMRNLCNALFGPSCNDTQLCDKSLQDSDTMNFPLSNHEILINSVNTVPSEGMDSRQCERFESVDPHPSCSTPLSVPFNTVSSTDESNILSKHNTLFDPSSNNTQLCDKALHDSDRMNFQSSNPEILINSVKTVPSEGMDSRQCERFESVDPHPSCLTPLSVPFNTVSSTDESNILSKHNTLFDPSCNNTQLCDKALHDSDRMNFQSSNPEILINSVKTEPSEDVDRRQCERLESAGPHPSDSTPFIVSFYSVSSMEEPPTLTLEKPQNLEEERGG